MKTLRLSAYVDTTLPRTAGRLLLVLGAFAIPMHCRAEITSPSDLAGLEVWLDAADTSTIHDSAGLVDQWDDKSGNGNHVMQIDDKRPTTGIATQNDLNVLSFDGGDDLENSVTSIAAPYTVFLVGMTGNTAIKGHWISGVGAGRSVLYYTAGDAQSGNLRMYAGVDQPWLGPPAYASGEFALIATEIDSDDTDWLDLNAAGPEHKNLGNFTLGPSGIRIGRDGDHGGGPLPAGSQLAEVVVFNHTLTDNERIDVNNYLATKWDLNVVPEPGSWQLLFAALASLGFVGVRASRSRIKYCP